MTSEESFDPAAILLEVLKSPNPELTEASRRHLRDDPRSWKTNLERRLKSAMVNGDEEQYKLALQELSRCVEKEKFFWWFMDLWEKLWVKQLIEQRS